MIKISLANARNDSQIWDYQGKRSADSYPVDHFQVIFILITTSFPKPDRSSGVSRSFSTGSPGNITHSLIVHNQ